MPNYTGNLNLAKPIPMEDAADIQVINENMDKIDTWSMDIDEKTKAATSEIPGIVKYGTEAATALEGSKLAEILGIEYGGVLNNNNQKVAGKGYYDTANKKIYKCTANTSINYADAGYFIEVSNNDLLGKLQNLITVYEENEFLIKKYSNGLMEIFFNTPIIPAPGSGRHYFPIPFIGTPIASGALSTANASGDDITEVIWGLVAVDKSGFGYSYERRFGSGYEQLCLGLSFVGKWK